MVKLLLKEKTPELFKALKKAHEKLLKQTRYSTDNILLEKNLNNHHDLENAYFKAILINAFYSTRMGADLVYQAATYINKNKKNIAQLIEKSALESKDLNFLDKFCHKKLSRDKSNLRSEDYNPYSFFTKYLAIHDRILNKKESKFPIYDTLVEKTIKSSDLFESKFNLRNYHSLYNTLQEIGTPYGGLTSIDNILWILGRFIFQNKDKKEKQISNFNKYLSQNSIDKLTKDIINSK